MVEEANIHIKDASLNWIDTLVCALANFWKNKWQCKLQMQGVCMEEAVVKAVRNFSSSFSSLEAKEGGEPNWDAVPKPN